MDTVGDSLLDDDEVEFLKNIPFFVVALADADVGDTDNE